MATSNGASAMEVPQRAMSRSSPGTIPIPIHTGKERAEQGLLDLRSPVNQNGSFEFDRVIMAGMVQKQSRKTKSWKPFFLVLRPNILSMYRNQSEEKLLKRIDLSEITAVSMVKDPKGRREHIFGVFSPSKNYRFQAVTDADAKLWVRTLRTESHADDVDAGSLPPDSPIMEQSDLNISSLALSPTERIDPQDPIHPRNVPQTRPPKVSFSQTREGVSIPTLIESPQLGGEQQFFNEGASFSDFSDSVPSRAEDSNLHAHRKAFQPGTPEASKSSLRPMGAQRNPSQLSINAEVDEERVIWQGHLLLLKSKGGVRQWKRLWAVLRPKRINFYKNEDEYATKKLIELGAVVSADEIDPISKHKLHCMQIIVEDKIYKFAAYDEESLARWLGALKSQLAKRKISEKPA